MGFWPTQTMSRRPISRSTGARWKGESSLTLGRQRRLIKLTSSRVIRSAVRHRFISFLEAMERPLILTQARRSELIPRDVAGRALRKWTRDLRAVVRSEGGIAHRSDRARGRWENTVTCYSQLSLPKQTTTGDTPFSAR